MPYLLQESTLCRVRNVADLHLCMAPYALDRFIHAHLTLSNWFDQKMARLRPERSVSDCRHTKSAERAHS
jgi:hypothetical protein